jgi:S-formylglutathione hydrolase FrmB
VTVAEPAGQEPQRHSLFSESNRRRFPVWYAVPPGDGPFPLLVLLHGVYDADGSSWWRQARAHEAAAAAPRPPVVVMPSDTGVEQGSGWCDWADGTTYAETHVVDEVLPWAQAELPVTDEVWLTGLSMGGYGAITLSLRNPGVFRSVSSTSGFLDPLRLFNFVPDAMERIWGTDPSAHDPRVLLRQPDVVVPPLALDCGVEDHLIEHNRAAHALLTELGVPHGYAEHEGGHTWDYWRDHLPDHLAFHAGAAGPLGPARQAPQTVVL